MHNQVTSGLCQCQVRRGKRGMTAQRCSSSCVAALWKILPSGQAPGLLQCRGAVPEVRRGSGGIGPCQRSTSAC